MRVSEGKIKYLVRPSDGRRLITSKGRFKETNFCGTMKKSLIAVVLGAFLLSAFAIPAYADNDSAKVKVESENKIKAQAPEMSVSINGNGQARIAGKVVSVSSSTLVVSSWGGNWTVNLASDAMLQNRSGKISLADIKVGDNVVVSGKASATAGLVLTGTVVKDMSLGFKVNATSTLDGRTYTVTLKNGETIQVSPGSSTASSSISANGKLKGLLNAFVQKFFGKANVEIEKD